jgi:hypothetical protein
VKTVDGTKEVKQHAAQTSTIIVTAFVFTS